MPTLVNNLRAIRGPVTAVPVTAGSGIEIAADTQNNQIVISANLEAGSGIEIVDDNGKAKIINSDNAQALPIVAGTGVKLSVVNNQVVVSADETVLWEGNSLADSAIQLSEAANNFEYIEIHAFWSGTGTTMSIREDIRSRFTPDTLNHSLSTIVPLGNSGYSQVYVACNVVKLANDYMSISSVLRFRSALNGSNPDTNDATRITKIVGINRLSN